MKLYYVYILRCADNSYYVGITSDLEVRTAQHQNGDDRKAYTYNRRPIQLVYFETFQHPMVAIAFEKQLKGWGRKKKEALIRGDISALKKLAKGC